MKIANTTDEFNNFYSSHLEKVKALAELGFKYIDMSFYTEDRQDSEIMSENWMDRILEIKEYGDLNGIEFVQSHLPGGNFLDSSENCDIILEANKRSLIACGILGIKNAVLHAGFAKDIGKQEFYERNRDYINLLLPILEKYNINLCIENSCKANLGKYFYFFNGKDLRDFLNYVNHPNVTACWDTGHANIEGSQYDDIIALGDKLTALHINDNNGEKDEHMLPYMGTMNVDEVMTALQEINYSGYFTFESSHSVFFFKGWPYKRKEFNLSNKACDPDLECRKIFTKAALTIGKRILTAYDCYEE